MLTTADVTDQEKLRRGLRTMRAVRERVGRTLDVVATCQELVEALVPGFADIAVVEVVEPVVRGEKPPLSPLGRDVPLRRAAFAHSGGERQILAHPVGDVRALFFPTPYAQVLVDLKPRAVVLGPDTPWLAADPARGQAIRDSGAHALLAAPLTLRGRVLGLLSIYRTRQADTFDEREVALILELATHTALSIDNARRYTHEHAIAAALQRHLLAMVPISRTAVETAHLNVADDKGGGGWFDVFDLPGARTALVVGRVAGHGIQAATTMGQLRTVIHSLAALDLEPDELLARLDDTVIRLAREREALPGGDPLHRQSLSATCLCVMYDPFSRTCAIASAGHPPPMLAGPDETPRVLDLAVGAALGEGGPPFAATTVPVADGDVLALYTAVLSAAGRSEEGTGGPRLLRHVLADTDRPLQDLCDDVLYQLRGDALSGDAILLLTRTHAFPADRTATWALDDDRTAPAIARRHARSQLATWGVDEDTAYATEEIVSELVTNALRYGAPPVRLHLIKDRTLTCEVHDSSPTAPRLRHAGTVDEGGRGLFICAQLAQNWGIRYNGQGKTVWTGPAPSR
ncbi:ATP-binding SpoIIE family protein phosphatase [Streptomyces yatensis]|uniref:ATP-binding SpoIIE family protein phosphatase n=1 Tax=Streptomyces yatensis TaxID=155177 RepID=UPI001FE97B84|nr:SpoIIE family protein phosphatase [Streptomyces yatensis]